jgi:hypothetical protein
MPFRRFPVGERFQLATDNRKIAKLIPVPWPPSSPNTKRWEGDELIKWWRNRGDYALALALIFSPLSRWHVVHSDWPVTKSFVQFGSYPGHYSYSFRLGYERQQAGVYFRVQALFTFKIQHCNFALVCRIIYSICFFQSHGSKIVTSVLKGFNSPKYISQRLKDIKIFNLATTTIPHGDGRSLRFREDTR